MEGNLFGTQNVSLMQQSSLTSASLDKQRAELARKHVRALNNQFVRWKVVSFMQKICTDSYLFDYYTFNKKIA